LSKVEIKKRRSLPELLERKSRGEKLSMVTCYDATMAKLINQTQIDMVLVGDSLGNVMMGYSGTLQVTLDHMIVYGSSVARTLKNAFLVLDMPFMSYQISPEQALENAGRLVKEAGAEAVKLEGGKAMAPAVKKIVDAGIPVIGHLGLTPQSINIIGSYKVIGRSDKAADDLLQDALALEAAGASMLVLEMVPESLAKKVSEALSIPTIGIGAGRYVDGQVLVLHDLLGFDEEFSPKFLKKYARLGAEARNALIQYDEEVKSKTFPDQEHSFGDKK
jgi:3-methyl-2-oxobutanoate hydroxymethyltransferase